MPTSEISWPHVPRHAAPAKCDRCDRDARRRSVLCAGCEDDQWWADKHAAEDNDEGLT